MKPTVAKEVAAAFERLKELRNYTSDNDLLSEHAEAVATKDWYDGLEPLNSVDLVTFAKMVLYGYEVEKTTEEKWAEKFKFAVLTRGNHAASFSDKYEALGRIRTISEMAKDFNLKIPGVNA